MPLQLITDATSEPITLAEAKSQCRVDGTDEDTLITAYIKTARISAENFCKRAMITQTWRLVLDEFPLPAPKPGSSTLVTAAIELDKPWVRSITNVKYIDSQGVEQTMSSNDYRLTAQPMVAGRLMPAYGLSWPSTRSDEGVITIDFVAGWDNTGAVPEPIKQAIRFWVAHFYANRESVIVGSIATEIPQACEHLLWPYRTF